MIFKSNRRLVHQNYPMKVTFLLSLEHLAEIFEAADSSSD
ncbi:unnamed protein product [Acidithrix sp. C25]|nr:unnamed protein product [Acidithrix sp. C25]